MWAGDNAIMSLLLSRIERSRLENDYVGLLGIIG
jgi:stalled ribosome alternative rescue factor ArfA